LPNIRDCTRARPSPSVKPMAIIDGNAVSETVLAELKGQTAGLTKTLGRAPGVLFIRVGEDPASVFYVSKKQKVAQSLGIESRLQVFPETVTREELCGFIDDANADDTVDGILVQAPLPPHIPDNVAFNRVAPEKDVDGFSTLNLGKLVQEDPAGFVACTPLGVAELLARSDVLTSGAHAVVLGRSLIVGKPAALLMMRKALPGNATVTVCHSLTRDIPVITRQADILIAALGKPHFVTADMIKEGATVIDVGINRVDDASRKRGYRIVGDVDYGNVAPKCERITPVPGGVGPMTVAMLMQNTVKACRQRNGLPEENPA